MLHYHTEVNETDLLRGCNGKGQTHKYRERTEATAAPVLSLHHPGSLLMLSKNQSKRANTLLLAAYRAYLAPPPITDHAQRAGSLKTSWI